MPTVSIVMPVYNGAAYLEQTLDALLVQSYTDFEVICVNDSSTDNSLAILERYAARDGRIKVFTKPNQGLASYSIAYGLTYASGEFYMYSSQDDLYSPDLLEKGIAVAEQTQADVVIPNMICYYGDGSDLSLRTFWQETVPDPAHTSPYDAFVLSLDWRIHGFCLYRTELVRSVGIDTSNYNSDELTTRQLFLFSRKIAFSDGIFYYRIDNPNAITKKMSLRLYEVFDTNERLEELARSHGVDSCVIVRLRELALNDVAIRQKLLYARGHELTKAERCEASYRTRQAYKRISDKKDLFRKDWLRRLCFTHGFWLLKMSMYVRALCGKK